MSGCLHKAPITELNVDGARMSDQVASLLSEFEVTLKISEPVSCKLVFVGITTESIADCGLKVGAKLELICDNDSVFLGVIEKVSVQANDVRDKIWTIEAKDQLWILNLQSRLKVFQSAAPAETIQEIVRNHGILANCLPKRERLLRRIQSGDTDLSFMQRIADEAGLYFLLLNDNTLSLFDEEGHGERYCFKVDHDVLEYTIIESIQESMASFRVFGWNIEANRIHYAENSQKSAIGDGLSYVTLADDDYAAARIAKREVRRSELNRKILEATVEGISRVVPGNLADIGKEHEDEFTGAFLSVVSKRFNAKSGYTTYFTSKLPKKISPKHQLIAAIGRIERLDDPEDLGRVQVSLPAYNNVEMGWLRVLTLGAGKKKGLVLLPDMHEEVLVLFPNGDPTTGIVLGGVYGNEDHPDWGISNNSVNRCTFTSRSGQVLRFSDDDHSIKIENDLGSLVELGKDKLTIKSKGDLELSAVGHNVTISGSRVDFVRK